jgi:hypothetical protein
VNDKYGSGGDDFFHVLGYVKPYISELSAVQAFQKHPRQGGKMLAVLASPATRDKFAYNTVSTGLHDFSSVVPSNELQRAIISGLDARIECIQGPPGTGKSTTIFHIMQSAIPSRYHCIITCVQNKALDSIAEKLGPTGMPFIVYGHPSRLGDEAKKFTLPAQVARDPEVLRIRAILSPMEGRRKLIRSRMTLIETSRFHKRAPRNPWKRWWLAYVTTQHALYHALKQDADECDRCCQRLTGALGEAETTAEASIMMDSKASLSTMDGLVSADLLPRPSIVIIDEAGTVPEYKFPLLLTHHVEAIVAIGDQNQLQPFSHTKDDQDEKPDGFFQRAVKALDKKVPMLKEQYRMHPAISDLVSNLFYRGELTTAPSILERRMAVPRGGIEWRDYPDIDAEYDDRVKRWNPVEVDMIGMFMCDELPRLLRNGKSVAIITFYKHHFNKIMEMGEEMGVVYTKTEAKAKPGAGRFKDANFRIVTVDAAQGSEADVIVLSCVRCNRQHTLGFITDKNRLCVALSRAREQLIIIGSSKTLSSDRTWRMVASAAK